MEATNVIILEYGPEPDQKEVWGSLAEICRTKGFKYNTLSRKKYPFKHDGITFIRVPFRQEIQ